jgi:hypothetical protein
MRVIRASEVAAYRFCKRAWWYQLHGYEPANKADLAGGIEGHNRHSRWVLAGNRLQRIAYAFLLLAILAAVLWLGGVQL